MIDANSMKVGDAVRDSDIRHNATSQCSICRVGPDRPRYPSDEVTVIRHWKTNSLFGTWVWYCPRHYATTKPWKSDALAPAGFRRDAA